MGMERDKSDPVRARPSATVVLVREGRSDPEILMVRRKAGYAFGDSYAFPGGVVDDDEPEAHAFCRGRTAEQADTELGLTSGGLDFYSAAIRELFEETGVLLARDNGGRWAFEGDPGTRLKLQKLRKRIDSGSLPWSIFLREHGLCMACDALHYFAHWETPLWRPKRWSARFFLAEMPSGQDARHDGIELTDSRWLSAAEALSIGGQGGMKLPFPTFRSLKTLSEFASVDALLDWARDRALQGVEKIRPVEITENGESRFLIRGDPGYPEGGDG
jgi:8-oxo-dGTP pyrophosphatase MutT (NUDIX family)